MDEVGLSFRRPNRAAGTIAVAVSRSVKGDDTVVLGGHVDKAARLEILDHAAIAVQQDQWFAFASLNVMDANPADLEEMAGRRILALGLVREATIYKGSDGQRPCCDQAGHCVPSRLRTRELLGNSRRRLTQRGGTCT